MELKIEEIRENIPSRNQPLVNELPTDENEDLTSGKKWTLIIFSVLTFISLAVTAIVILLMLSACFS